MRFAARVRRLGWQAFVPRFRSWALVVAILPTLTFLGHWTLHVDIPGTNLFVMVVPGQPEPVHTHDAGQQDDGHSHEQHCHAGVAACSDIPFTGASPFALLNDSLAYLGACGALTVLAVLFWRPGTSANVSPDLRPPRFLAA